MDSPEETKHFLIKFGIYIVGVALGLAAKLATINKDKSLTLKEIILHTTVALASAWLVWNILDHYNAESWLKNGISVLVGRFGDSFLIMIWNRFKKAESEDKPL